MNVLFNDLKYAWRMLRKCPGFTVVVTLIIGLGVGANTAIFNALDQVALRSMPVKNPHELVNIQYQYRDYEGNLGTDGITHYPAYTAFREQSQLFTDVIAFGYGDTKLRDAQGLQTIKGLCVSGNYFSLLGVQPALGRLFNEKKEPDHQAPPTVILRTQDSAISMSRSSSILDIMGGWLGRPWISRVP